MHRKLLGMNWIGVVRKAREGVRVCESLSLVRGCNGGQLLQELAVYIPHVLRAAHHGLERGHHLLLVQLLPVNVAEPRMIHQVLERAAAQPLLGVSYEQARAHVERVRSRHS